MIEDDQALLAEWKYQGYTYDEIQEAFAKRGRHLSVRQLKYDMAALRKAWAEIRIKSIDGMVQEELARIQAMESLAWKKFYACTSTKNKETIEQAVPIGDDDGEPHLFWQDRKRIVVTEDSREDEKFWWKEINKLHEERRKLLGMYRTKIDVNAQVAHVVKGYVSWSPKGWDDQPAIESNVVQDGEYSELTDGDD